MTLTSPRGLKTVKQVYSLDIVGQRGVWHQGPVPVYVGYSKFKGQFLNTDGLIFKRLKDAPCKKEEKQGR